MKKILLSMAVVLTLGSSVPVDAQRHRHTPRTETVVSTSAAPHSSASKKSQASNNKDEGIEAFSDTSSVDTSTTTIYNGAGNGAKNNPDSFDSDFMNDPLWWLGGSTASRFLGGTFLVILVLFGIIIALMPLIIVALIIRYLVKRDKEHIRLAEKAMEKGKPLNEEQMPLSKKSPDYMWRRGIRNVSIGVGLMVFFWFLGAESLAGIGGLVACLGVGQMVMVRYNYNGKFGQRNDINDDLNRM